MKNYATVARREPRTKGRRVTGNYHKFYKTITFIYVEEERNDGPLARKKRKKYANFADIPAYRFKTVHVRTYTAAKLRAPTMSNKM